MRLVSVFSLVLVLLTAAQAQNFCSLAWSFVAPNGTVSPVIAFDPNGGGTVFFKTRVDPTLGNVTDILHTNSTGHFTTETTNQLWTPTAADFLGDVPYSYGMGKYKPTEQNIEGIFYSNGLNRPFILPSDVNTFDMRALGGFGGMTLRYVDSMSGMGALFMMFSVVILQQDTRIDPDKAMVTSDREVVAAGKDTGNTTAFGGAIVSLYDNQFGRVYFESASNIQNRRGTVLHDYQIGVTRGFGTSSDQAFFAHNVNSVLVSQSYVLSMYDFIAKQITSSATQTGLCAQIVAHDPSLVYVRGAFGIRCYENL